MSNAQPPAQEPQQPGWGYQRPPGQGQWGPPPPGYEPPPPAPPPRRRVWLWIVVGVAIFAVGGCVATIIALTAGVSHEIHRTQKVFYQVTGDAKSVTVVYTTWNADTSSTSQQSVTPPWSKEQSTSGIFRGGHLTVTVGADGGSATCSMSVDNGRPKTATAVGAYSSASCDVR